MEGLRVDHTIFLSCSDIKDRPRSASHLRRPGCMNSAGGEKNIAYIVERVHGRAPSPMQWDSNVVGGFLYSVGVPSVWRKWWSWSGLQKLKANLPPGCIRVGMDGNMSKLRKCDAWKQPVSSKCWNGPPEDPGENWHYPIPGIIATRGGNNRVFTQRTYDRVSFEHRGQDPKAPGSSTVRDRAELLFLLSPQFLSAVSAPINLPWTAWWYFGYPGLQIFWGGSIKVALS